MTSKAQDSGGNLSPLLPVEIGRLVIFGHCFTFIIRWYANYDLVLRTCVCFLYVSLDLHILGHHQLPQDAGLLHRGGCQSERIECSGREEVTEKHRNGLK